MECLSGFPAHGIFVSFSDFMSHVAYLGPAGTFSGILARQRFGESPAHLACPTIEAVFDNLIAGDVSCGLVPVENSSGGTVYDTVDLLIRHAGRIFVREELSLDIRIALLGHVGMPIRTVYSHFTQIKHHAAWLKEFYPKAKVVEVHSTALAATKAATSPHSAALAAPGASKLYGLKVLEIPSGCGGVNVTNFFVISRRPCRVKNPSRTALVVGFRNECGSLHKFLGPFARQGVSLTRIISRPVPGQPQTYVFYVEIEGGDRSSNVERALLQSRKMADQLVSLGSFKVGRRFSS